MDMFRSYAEHPFWSIVLFVVVAEMAYLLFKSRQQGISMLRNKVVKNVTVGAALKWAVTAILIAVIAVTLNMKGLPDNTA